WAAEHLCHANALRLADWRRRGKGYDPGEHDRFVDCLIATFTPDYFAAWLGLGVADIEHLDSDSRVAKLLLPQVSVNERKRSGGQSSVDSVSRGITPKSSESSCTVRVSDVSEDRASQADLCQQLAKDGALFIGVGPGVGRVRLQRRGRQRPVGDDAVAEVHGV